MEETPEQPDTTEPELEENELADFILNHESEIAGEEEGEAEPEELGEEELAEEEEEELPAPQPEPAPQPPSEPPPAQPARKEPTPKPQPKPKPEPRSFDPVLERDWSSFVEFIKVKHGKLNSEQTSYMNDWKNRDPNALSEFNQKLELLRRIGNVKYKNPSQLTMDDYLAWYALETGKVTLGEPVERLIGLERSKPTASAPKAVPARAQINFSRRPTPGPWNFVNW